MGMYQKMKKIIEEIKEGSREINEQYPKTFRESWKNSPKSTHRLFENWGETPEEELRREIQELKKKNKELENQQYGGFRNLGEVMYACKATKEIWGKKD